MKIAYIVSLAAVIAVIMHCVAAAKKSKVKGRKHLVRFLDAALVCVAANMLIACAAGERMACAAGERMALASYALYFSALDWLAAFFFYFCYEYAGVKKSNGFSSGILFFFCVFDTLSFLANVFTKHAFKVHQVEFFGSAFYNWSSSLFYATHLIFVYFTLFISFLCLLWAFVRSPMPYRLAYLNIFSVIMLVVLVNAAVIATDSPIDFSIVFYGLIIACFLYGPFALRKKQLATRIMESVAEQTDFGLVLFDKDKACVFMNDFMKRLLRTDEEHLLSAPLVRHWLRTNDIMPLHDYQEDVEFMGLTDGEKRKRYYHIAFSRFSDKRGRLVGSSYIVSDITAEVERHEHDHFVATHDQLTGIYNKEQFYAKTKALLEKNPDTDFMLVVSDIVNFKLVNDLCGTERGDTVLLRIAAEMRSRAVENEVYARLHNDHFALVMPKQLYSESLFLPGPQSLFAYLETFPHSLICQVGVYEIVERDIPVSIMCDKAFLALETIRGQYNVTIAYYDEELRLSAIKLQTLMDSLPSAIDNHELFMYLQPQFNAKGSVLGAEALVRWHHPTKGEILPSEFIAVVEKNGMVCQIDFYIWREACAKLAEWKEMGRTEFYISVNISPKDFYLLDIYEVFTGLVGEFGISPGNLNLEITETAIMQDFERQMALIDRLRAFGFTVEIDDFGSGYSSLNMLKDMNADVLKVDMQFLQESNRNEKSKIILEKIISLSKELGMKVVTEGVEKKAQVDFLDSVGCDIYQGFYFSRPITAAEFERRYF